jgi:predicted DNA-binding protein with PD1-like motif
MESRSLRRVIGSLRRGEDLVPGLLAACAAHKVRAGVIQAQGALERVELATLDLGTGRFRAGRALEGVELVSMRGHLAVADDELDLSAKVLVARDRETIAGHLVAARVFAVEYVIEAWDDLVLTRPHGVGFRAWGDSPAAPAAPSPPAKVSWADVAAASPAADPDNDDQDDSLSPGDILQHPTFGRAEVMRIEGAYEFAHVRLKNGRLVRLSLDVLKVQAAGNEGGRRVWKARVDG